MYLYLDLDFILFKIIHLPWNDIKYKKDYIEYSILHLLIYLVQ